MATKSKISILTSSHESQNEDWRMLENFLSVKGFETSIVVWDEIKNPIHSDLAIVGPVWNYTTFHAKFLNVCKSISNQTILVNSWETIRWNSDKVYQKELIENDIRCITSEFLDSWDEDVISASVQNFSSSVVLKPSIGAGGRGIFKISNQKELKNVIPQMLKSGTPIIQEFNECIHKGEISSIFINNKYSHSVIKHAKQGEFRVQNHYGGKYNLYKPEKKEIEFCKKVLNASPTHSYARVDYIIDIDPILVEVELIEPDLFLRYDRQSLIYFYKMIKNKLN